MFSLIKKLRDEAKSSVKAALQLDRHKEADTQPREVSYRATSDAADELLARYQDEWRNIRLNSEANSKQAHRVDAQARLVQSSLQTRSEDLRKFGEELRHASAIQRDLLAVTERISSVHELCVAVEDALMLLEDACEEQDLLRHKGSHMQQLAAYRQRRHGEVEAVAVKMAEEFARRMKKQQQQLSGVDGRRIRASPASDLQERQKYFDEAFKEDVERFRAGEAQLRADPNPARQKEAEEELARVELSEEQLAAARELDQFLAAGSSPSQSGAQDQHPFTNSYESAVSTASLEWDCTTDKPSPKPEEMPADAVDTSSDTDVVVHVADGAAGMHAMDFGEKPYAALHAPTGKTNGGDIMGVDADTGADATTELPPSALLGKQEVAVVGPLVAAEL